MALTANISNKFSIYITSSAAETKTIANPGNELNRSEFMDFRIICVKCFNDGGTGNLQLLTSNLKVLSPDGSETYLSAEGNGPVQLYHDNSRKFATTGVGATVTGEMHATTFHGDGSQLTGVAAAGSGGGALDITSCLFI